MTKFFIYILLADLIAVFYILKFTIRRYNIVASFPVAKANSAQQGINTFEGVALPYNDNELIAPSGKPCIWYKYSIQKHLGDLLCRYRTAGYPVTKAGSSASFILDDGSGKILINPPKKLKKIKLLYLKNDFDDHQEMWKSYSSDSSEQALNKTSVFDPLFTVTSSYIWRESCINKGDKIIIKGKFTPLSNHSNINGIIEGELLILSNQPKDKIVENCLMKVVVAGLVTFLTTIAGSMLLYSLLIGGS